MSLCCDMAPGVCVCVCDMAPGVCVCVCGVCVCVRVCLRVPQRCVWTLGLPLSAIDSKMRVPCTSHNGESKC